MSFDEPPRPGGRPPEAWALALTAAWLVAVAIGWLVLGARAGAAVAALAALTPLALIWLAAAAARRDARAEEERGRLRSQIEALGAELRALASGTPPQGARDEPREGVRAAHGDMHGDERRDGADPRAARPQSRSQSRAQSRPAPRPVEAPAEEEAEAPPLPVQTFVRALDFPEDAEDEAGFEALRRALADPHARKLVQASQDVLTLLSQNGVYMDELHAAPAQASVWRRFAGGVRGPSVAALAGVRDEAALELASARMARDTIFRDAAQHFLRQFDVALKRFVAHASDEEIAALAQTRTARAFMLVARATRGFD